MEQGTKVDDGRSGDVVATRTAIETDEQDRPRVIQLVTQVSRYAEMKKIRGISAPESSTDSWDLNYCTELTANMLTVGDRETLVCRVGHFASGGSVTLTPVVKLTDITAEPATEIYAILSSKTTECGATFFTEDDTEYWSPLLYWDLAGAKAVGIHITGLSEENSVTVWGGLL
jgi:hypothetical protein